MTLEAGGRVREKVRAVGERSEAAGGSDQRQGPWEVQRGKTSGFGWKVLLMTSQWSLSPSSTVDAGYQVPPQIEDMSSEKVNL